MLRGGYQLPPARLQTQNQQGERIFMDVGAALKVLELGRFSYLGVGEINTQEVKRLKEELPGNLILIQKPAKKKI